MAEVREFRPNRGPQEAFLSTRADIAIYGGSAGAGKSFAIALDPIRHVHRPTFGAVVFRRDSTRLVGPGSIWEETSGIYPLLGMGARPRESPVLEWRFKSGALIEYRHLQHEKDRLSHGGKAYAAIYFDELCEFEESQFWFLMSRNRSTCGIRPYIRATCNPDPDSFVRKLIDWWIGEDGFPIRARSGVLRWFVRDEEDLIWSSDPEELRERFPERTPVSLTFIAASLADNPKGDPNYAAKLQALPRVDRERLLGGNWNTRATAGTYFRRSMFPIVPALVEGDVRRRIRAWDKAATAVSATNKDPDWTVGVKLAELRSGGYVIEHVERMRGAPADVEATIRRVAATDGIATEVVIWQDPGQAGVVDVDRMRTVLKGHRFRAIRAAKDKLTYAGVWQSQADGGRVSLAKGTWNDVYLSELEAFPEGKHDDSVDATSLAFQLVFGSNYMATLREAMKRGLHG